MVSETLLDIKARARQENCHYLVLVGPNGNHTRIAVLNPQDMHAPGSALAAWDHLYSVVERQKADTQGRILAAEYDGQISIHTCAWHAQMLWSGMSGLDKSTLNVVALKDSFGKDILLIGSMGFTTVTRSLDRSRSLTDLSNIYIRPAVRELHDAVEKMLETQP